MLLVGASSWVGAEECLSDQAFACSLLQRVGWKEGTAAVRGANAEMGDFVLRQVAPGTLKQPEAGAQLVWGILD